MYRDYKSGLTPNPDILCNKLIKFPLFWKESRKLGAQFIAMGHYARIKKTNLGYELRAGKKNKIKPKQGIVKDPEGNIIGIHEGVQYYTIGQKTGEHIGIKINKPKRDSQKRFYIAKKDEPNTLIVAPEGHPILKNSVIKIKSFHKINPKELIEYNLKARIRHLGKLHSISSLGLIL